MDDEDVSDLFAEGELAPARESEAGATQIENKARHLKPLSQATSATESDPGYEEWARQFQPRQWLLPPHMSRPAAPSAPPTESLDLGELALPSTQPESQSWETDASAYEFPPEALEFFEMFEDDD